MGVCVCEWAIMRFTLIRISEALKEIEQGHRGDIITGCNLMRAQMTAAGTHGQAVRATIMEPLSESESER